MLLADTPKSLKSLIIIKSRNTLMAKRFWDCQKCCRLVMDFLMEGEEKEQQFAIFVISAFYGLGGGQFIALRNILINTSIHHILFRIRTRFMRLWSI